MGIRVELARRRVAEYREITSGVCSCKNNPDVQISDKGVSLAYMMSLCGINPTPPSLIDRLLSKLPLKSVPTRG